MVSMKHKKQKNQNSLENLQQDFDSIQKLTAEDEENITGGSSKGLVWCVQNAKNGIGFGDSYFSRIPPNGFTTVPSYHCGENTLG